MRKRDIGDRSKSLIAKREAALEKKRAEISELEESRLSEECTFAPSPVVDPEKTKRLSESFRSRLASARSPSKASVPPATDAPTFSPRILAKSREMAKSEVDVFERLSSPTKRRARSLASGSKLPPTTPVASNRKVVSPESARKRSDLLYTDSVKRRERKTLLLRSLKKRVLTDSTFVTSTESKRLVLDRWDRTVDEAFGIKGDHIVRSPRRAAADAFSNVEATRKKNELEDLERLFSSRKNQLEEAEAKLNEVRDPEFREKNESELERKREIALNLEKELSSLAHALDVDLPEKIEAANARLNRLKSKDDEDLRSKEESNLEALRVEREDVTSRIVALEAKLEDLRNFIEKATAAALDAVQSGVDLESEIVELKALVDRDDVEREKLKAELEEIESHQQQSSPPPPPPPNVDDNPPPPPKRDPIEVLRQCGLIQKKDLGPKTPAATAKARQAMASYARNPSSLKSLIRTTLEGEASEEFPEDAVKACARLMLERLARPRHVVDQSSNQRLVLRERTEDDVEFRLLRFGQAKMERLKVARKRRQEMELSDCTFAPKITRYSADDSPQIVVDENSPVSDRFEALYKQAEQRTARLKKAMKAHKEIVEKRGVEGCTFAPRSVNKKIVETPVPEIEEKSIGIHVARQEKGRADRQALSERLQALGEPKISSEIAKTLTPFRLRTDERAALRKRMSTAPMATFSLEIDLRGDGTEFVVLDVVEDATTEEVLDAFFGEYPDAAVDRAELGSMVRAALKDAVAKDDDRWDEAESPPVLLSAGRRRSPPARPVARAPPPSAMKMSSPLKAPPEWAPSPTKPPPPPDHSPPASLTPPSSQKRRRSPRTADELDDSRVSRVSRSPPTASLPAAAAYVSAPDDWTLHLDRESERWFFYNTTTQRRSWSVPTEVSNLESVPFIVGVDGQAAA